MHKSDIIKDIKVLKNLPLDSSSAYAVRIRVLRHTIGLLQKISQYLDLPKPNRLEKVKKENIKSNIKDICVLYNSLVEITLSISQPSEALDKRWEIKWKRFLNELQKIEIFFVKQ